MCGMQASAKMQVATALCPRRQPRRKSNQGQTQCPLRASGLSQRSSISRMQTAIRRSVISASFAPQAEQDNAATRIQQIQRQKIAKKRVAHKRKEMRMESGDQLNFFVIIYHHVVGVHDEVNSPSAELP